MIVARADRRYRRGQDAAEEAAKDRREHVVRAIWQRWLDSPMRHGLISSRTNFEAVLSAEDYRRTAAILEKVDACGLVSYAITGGLALEVGLPSASARARPFNDIDLVVERFEDLPVALNDHFLIRHVHPSRPAGKLIMQLVDPGEAVRVV